MSGDFEMFLELHDFLEEEEEEEEEEEDVNVNSLKASIDVRLQSLLEKIPSIFCDEKCGEL